MKYTFLFFFFLLTCNSQAQNLEWLVSGGGAKSDKGTTIVIDEQGNSYITGYYNEEANFGPLNTGFSFTQSKEVFVAKLDPDGNFIWQTHGLNYFDDRGLGLAIDELGNTYVTGTCWGGLEWPPLSVYCPTSYTDQIFVTKIDNSGNVVWMKNAGNHSLDGNWYNDDHGLDIVADQNGSVFVTGFISNTHAIALPANFDNIAINIPPYDSLAFVGKLDTDGNWQWIETFEGIVEQRDNAISMDDEGNVYVTGGFKNTKQFGSTNLTSNGGSDIYVIKYDTDGNFIWAQSAGGLLDDRGNGLVDGHDGFMYVTGEFRDISTFGIYTLDNAGGPKGRDIFVAKMSKNGVWKWCRRAGSKKGSDRGNYIASNAIGNLFVTGQFSSEADFGNFTIDSSGDSVQVFTAAIDTAGIWRWVIQGGGPSYDRGQGIAVDDDCNAWVVGYFDSSMDLMGTSIAPNQGKDIFAFKLTDICFGYDDEPNPDPVPEGCTIDVGNIFTPNGDNINDFLTFSNNCNTNFYAVVINRWGNIVYESTDAFAQWDGNSPMGIPVKEGVYFYRVVVTLESAEDQEYSGFIQLER